RLKAKKADNSVWRALRLKSCPAKNSGIKRKRFLTHCFTRMSLNTAVNFCVVNAYAIIVRILKIKESARKIYLKINNYSIHIYVFPDNGPKNINPVLYA